MGYDIFITRKEEWFDEEGDEISLEEWINYVNSAADMRYDGFAEAETPKGILRVESEGLSVWLGYSGHEKDENMAWFDYCAGNVKVKNPDEEILKKMHQVATSLSAKVQGEECEIYDANGRSSWQELKEESDAIRTTVSKKWWQFWK